MLVHDIPRCDIPHEQVIKCRCTVLHILEVRIANKYVTEHGYFVLDAFAS